MLFATSILLSLVPTILAADSSSKPKATAKPCTIHSPTTGSYFDLNTINKPSSSSSNGKAESWHSRGYDYGANFTINFCGPVVEDLGKVDGISESRTANISAFYKMDGKTYSIGEANTEPIFRGRKLVLNYTNGSPCPESPISSLSPRKIVEDDEGDNTAELKNSSTRNSSIRRKSTIMSFLCDRDPQYTEKPQISFIGTPDSCSYYFEIRSRAACGGAVSQSPSSLGPGGVFGVILGIAVCVYLIGGCAYQRTVMHQRGWRQCPNWGAWKGLFDLLGDTFIILTSSLSRALHLPTLSFNRAFNTGGYHRVGDDRSTFGYGGGGSSSNRGSAGFIGRGVGGVGIGGRGGGRGGVGTEDDENRLIDQLDEEWDD